MYAIVGYIKSTRPTAEAKDVQLKKMIMMNFTFPPCATVSKRVLVKTFHMKMNWIDISSRKRSTKYKYLHYEWYLNSLGKLHVPLGVSNLKELSSITRFVNP